MKLANVHNRLSLFSCVSQEHESADGEDSSLRVLLAEDGPLGKCADLIRGNLRSGLSDQTQRIESSQTAGQSKKSRTAGTRAGDGCKTRMHANFQCVQNKAIDKIKFER
jgi:hypothetical protein